LSGYTTQLRDITTQYILDGKLCFQQFLSSGMIQIPLRATSVSTYAGLWEEWKSPEGELLQTCTIITTEANELTSDYQQSVLNAFRHQWKIHATS
jgi:hypothetical protein